MTENEKMNAYIWAAKVHPKAIPLVGLAKGDKFVWPPPILTPGDSNVKLYRGSGWYRVLDAFGNPVGRCFRTGVKTAVIQVKE